jgi:hypothetical protein
MTMNCDQVFVILTRGPFPTGEPWDEVVEAHLETCGGCWRLAEALRPALEVFQEAVPPAESRDLPGYWGDARPAATVVAELTSPSRTPLASGVRRIARPNGNQQYDVLRAGLAAEVFRAAVLASTLTAAVIGLLLWWRG